MTPIYHTTNYAYIGRRFLEQELESSNYLDNIRDEKIIKIIYKDDGYDYEYTPEEDSKYGCIIETATYYFDIEDAKVSQIEFYERQIKRLTNDIERIKNQEFKS